MKEPPPDAAADTPEKPWLFWECFKWKKVMDDFFHGQLRAAAAGCRRAGLNPGKARHSGAFLPIGPNLRAPEPGVPRAPDHPSTPVPPR